MSRSYFLEDRLHPKGGVEYICEDDDDCVFCDHCDAVFWDYTNGIYMVGCDADHDASIRHCPYFKETKEDDK